MSVDEHSRRTLEHRLLRAAETVTNWTKADTKLLSEARSLVPFDELLSTQHNKYVRDDDVKYMHPTDTDVLLLKRMTLWFQKDYMTWVNSPSCEMCGSSDVKSNGMSGPVTEEEVRGGANRVEVYRCGNCGADVRFPRFNDVKALMRSRRGRCGEFANLYGFFCTAVGFETRYVYDFTDHVWTEVWSHRLGRWIMADSCEGKIDEPSMYEKGWGKNLNAIFGFSMDSCEEITKRYTRKFDSAEFQQRRAQCFGVSANTNIDVLVTMVVSAVDSNIRYQNGRLSASRVNELERRKSAERSFFAKCQIEEWDDAGTSEGRISGSLSWKVERGEAGVLGKMTPSSSGKVGSASSKPEVITIDPYLLSMSCKEVEIIVKASRSDCDVTCMYESAITINGSFCAVGCKGFHAVIIDEIVGCVLNRGVFFDSTSFLDFVRLIPNGRIIVCCTIGLTWNSTLSLDILNYLYNFPYQMCDCFAYVGQVGIASEWTLFDESYISISLKLEERESHYSLATEKKSIPFQVSCRVSDDIMSLDMQLVASEDQKIAAGKNALKLLGSRYVGFTSRKGRPIYLLTADCFPLQYSSNSEWTTYHYLPSELQNATKEPPMYVYPVDNEYFVEILGQNLISCGGDRVETREAVENKRFVGIYFSAHWCPPCRRFSPLLIEFYTCHKEIYPNDLEIVFASSDRDLKSFEGYFSSMPWLALPFEDRNWVEKVKRKFGVRGIPSLVILDTISGEVVSSQSARNEVAQCNGNTTAVLATWSASLPSESIELVENIKLSMEEPIIDKVVDKRERYMFKDERYMFKDDSNGIDNVKVDVNPSDRIKEIFDYFIKLNRSPNEAAAEAIKCFGEETKRSNVFLPWKGTLRPKQSVSVPIEPNNSNSVKGLNEISLKYVTKARENPHNFKYRIIKVDNKVFDTITANPSGLQILISRGFSIFSTEENFYVSIPLAADLDSLIEKFSI